MNSSLYFIKHLHQEGVNGNGDKTPSILNLGVDGVLCTGRFHLVEKNITSHWVGPRDGLNPRVKEKYLAPIRIKPRFLGC